VSIEKRCRFKNLGSAFCMIVLVLEVDFKKDLENANTLFPEMKSNFYLPKCKYAFGYFFCPYSVFFWKQDPWIFLGIYRKPFRLISL